MTTIRHTLIALPMLTVALATPAFAQNEAALRDYFEGRRVTLRMDMPGTAKGVNVYPESRRDIDFSEYGDSLRRYGPAIRAGEIVWVTKVKVKKDLIEFQLAGGGFGTFFDDDSTSVHIPYVPKSEREFAIERQLRYETNRNVRRQLERELDALRDRRDRENRRIDAERARLSEWKADRVFEQRLNRGSRFNLRFRGRVPYDIRPEDIMAALAPYVDFHAVDGYARVRPPFAIPRRR